jgi:hypothetical protein
VFDLVIHLGMRRLGTSDWDRMSEQFYDSSSLIPIHWIIHVSRIATDLGLLVRVPKLKKKVKHTSLVILKMMSAGIKGGKLVVVSIELTLKQDP